MPPAPQPSAGQRRRARAWPRRAASCAPTEECRCPGSRLRFAVLASRSDVGHAETKSALEASEPVTIWSCAWCQSLLDQTTIRLGVNSCAPDERDFAGKAVAGREYDVRKGGHPQGRTLKTSERAVRNSGHAAPRWSYAVLRQSGIEALSLVGLLEGAACETYVRAVRCCLRPPVKAQAAILAAPGAHHPRTTLSSDFAAKTALDFKNFRAPAQLERATQQVRQTAAQSAWSVSVLKL